MLTISSTTSPPSASLRRRRARCSAARSSGAIGTISVRKRIRRALAAGGLSPVFQPIMRLDSGRARRLRSAHPVRGRHAARSDDRRRALGRSGSSSSRSPVLAAALEAADALPQDAWLSLNVSPSVILASPASFQLTPGRPAAPVRARDHGARRDRRLRGGSRRRWRAWGLPSTWPSTMPGRGLRAFAISWSSQPRFLKLDPSLVRHVDLDLARQAMIAGLCHFAARAGCEVIAEGIEDVRRARDASRAWRPARPGLSPRATEGISAERKT